MAFIWWSINVFLGCLFGLEVFHQKMIKDSKMHKRLHFNALYTFLTFSLISLLALLREMLPGMWNESPSLVIGVALALLVLAMGMPLLRLSQRSLSIRYTIVGLFMVMLGVKFSSSPVHIAAPMLCTAGVLLQYFGYALSLKKLNRDRCLHEM